VKFGGTVFDKVKRGENPLAAVTDWNRKTGLYPHLPTNARMEGTAAETLSIDERLVCVSEIIKVEDGKKLGQFLGNRFHHDGGNTARTV
jgi:hypothetical protein